MSVRKRGTKWIATTYDPTLGRKVHVGTYDSKPEAREAELEAWNNLKVSKRRRETCDGFAERWMQDYPRNRESTTKHYEERIAKFALDFKGRPLDSVDRVEARAWALKNRSRSATVRAMFSDAVRDGLCRTNPFLNLRLEGSRGRKDLVVPTEEELGELILLARKLHGDFGRQVLGNFIQAGAYTGLRPGEMYGLRWDDIDFKGRTLSVERQWNQKLQRFTPPKTEESFRTIFLSPPAAEALEQIPRLRDEVFWAPQGGMLSGTVMSHYWRPVVNAANRPEFTPHCLRHYYGTDLARRGIGPIEIAKAMGHGDGGRMAMSTYLHITERESRDRIAASFGGNVRDLKAVGE